MVIKHLLIHLAAQPLAASLEAHPPAPLGQPDYSAITIAAALGYLDLRMGGHWRTGRPAIAAWLDSFAAKVPAFTDTLPSG